MWSTSRARRQRHGRVELPVVELPERVLFPALRRLAFTFNDELIVLHADMYIVLRHTSGTARRESVLSFHADSSTG